MTFHFQLQIENLEKSSICVTNDLFMVLKSYLSLISSNKPYTDHKFQSIQILVEFDDFKFKEEEKNRKQNLSIL